MKELVLGSVSHARGHSLWGGADQAYCATHECRQSWIALVFCISD